MAKRVIFPSGKQKKFIKYFKSKMKFSWKELSKKLSIPESTLSHAYQFESCSLPEKVFEKIVILLEEDKDALLRKNQAIMQEESIVIGRKMIGTQKNTFDKVKLGYTKNSRQLDNSNVTFSLSDKKKGIILPNKLTPELAEEIGMHYGDGFLSDKRFTYRLKGNLRDEREYYENYIGPLFDKLYNLELDLKPYQTTYGFELYSQALCEFKVKTLGIKPGKKQDIEFPNCLKINDEKILTSFLRGLFDTDGNIYFKSAYGYKKYYPRIALALYSKKVVLEVEKILTMLGFKPRIYFARNQAIVVLNGIKSLLRYESMVGWNSPKNLKKVKDWKDRYPELNKENMADVV